MRGGMWHHHTWLSMVNNSSKYAKNTGIPNQSTPPTQDSSHKQRFRLGFPYHKCMKIPVVTGILAGG